MTYYKILNNGKSPYANFDYTEYLPKNGKPGKWLPKFDKLELCKSGYHVTDAEHLIDWIDGNQLFEVEVEGKALKGDNKTTCQKIRFVRQVEGWNDKNLRFFAFWCAEQVLPIYEEKYPDDNRPRRAIETARRYAEGLATEGELAAARTAAWAAAWAAASDAAWDAAWDAAGDAALYTQVEFVCAGLQLEEKHREHARARWEVWAKGYGLLCDVDGVLYVYERIE